MKTVRIREKIKAFLAERPRNTAEILEHINSTMRHGTTSQQLGNVLSRTRTLSRSDTSSAPAFFPVDMTSASGQPASGSLTTILSGMAKDPSSWIATDADSSVDTQLPSTWGFGPGLLGVFFVSEARIPLAGA